MKLVSSILALVLVPVVSFSQVNVFSCQSVPQALLNQSTLHTAYCFEFSDSIQHTHTNNQTTFEALGHIQIKQGFTSGGYTQGNSGLDLHLQPKAAWDDIYVYSQPDLDNVGRFEKFELGFTLPDSIQQHIDDFLVDTGAVGGINPYLEWEIRILAKIEIPIGGVVEFVDAFWYQEYERDMSAPDLDDWGWNKISTDNPWRVRYAPRRNGVHKCHVEVYLNGEATPSLTSPSFEFNVVPSSNQGFVYTSGANRYLKLNNHTFFPAGINIRTPECSACPVATQWTSNKGGLAEYLDYRDMMTQIVNNGGNFARILNAPFSMDIEWEELGNYTDRLDYAWEMDRMFEHAEDIGLYIEWNLHNHMAFESPGYFGHVYWDWSMEPQHSPDNWYCYPKQLGIDVEGFLTDQTAMDYYNQRARYYISRYGYSTSIAMIELMSEANNLGYQRSGTTEFKPYNDAFDNINMVPHDTIDWQQKIGAWHRQYSDYVKVHLGHRHHLIGVSYTGSISYADDSYTLPSVDFNGWNRYSKHIDKYDGFTGLVNGRYSNYGRPQFHSEGLYGPDLHACADETWWRMDYWNAAFSGVAGIIPWSEHRNPSAYASFGAFNTFMNAQDLEWQSGLNNYFWNNRHAVRSDNLVEISFLTSPDLELATGVVTNRTVNYYTTRDASTDVNSSNPDDWTFCQEISSINANGLVLFSAAIPLQDDPQKPLRITGLKVKKYFVNYFDPITLQWLGQTNDWGPNVSIEFPLLNINRPQVLFQVHTDDSNFLPLQTSEANANSLGLNDVMDEPVGDASFSNRNGETSNLNVVPNPSTGILTIHIGGLDQKYVFDVFSSSGALVHSIKIANGITQLDLTHLSKGLYFGVLNSETAITRTKIIIQ